MKTFRKRNEDMPKIEIEKKDISAGDLMTFGKQYSVYHATVAKYRRRQFCLKALERRHFSNEKHFNDSLKIERYIFKHCCSHPFIPTIYAHYTDEKSSSAMFLMDTFSPRTLGNILVENTRLPQTVTVFYIAQIISVLAYLHKNGIIYRDLRPEYIHLNAANHIQIIQFNRAELHSNLASLQNKSNKVEYSNGNHRNSAIEIEEKSATIESMEIKKEKKSKYTNYPFASRALGCLIYKCLVGKQPFENSNPKKVRQSMAECNVKMPEYMSEDSKDIILLLLHPNPNIRLGSQGFAEICAHPFFCEVNWDWAALASIDFKKHWTEFETFSSTQLNRVRSRSEAIAIVNPLTSPRNIYNQNQWHSILRPKEKLYLCSDAQIKTDHWSSKKIHSGTVLFTTRRRLLFVKNGAIKIELAQSQIVSTAAIDDTTLSVRTVKNVFIIQLLGTKSDKWKATLENWSNVAKKVKS